MSDAAIPYSMYLAIRRIDRIKDRSGWAVVLQLKNMGVHGQTLRGLFNRGLIEKHFVGPIDDENCVRLTRAGRRHV